MESNLFLFFVQDEVDGPEGDNAEDKCEEEGEILYILYTLAWWSRNEHVCSLTERFKFKPQLGLPFEVL